MKDLGDASYVLGIKVLRNRSFRMLGLSQASYVDKILSNYRIDQCKGALTPFRLDLALSSKMYPWTREEKERISKIPYTSTEEDLSKLCFVKGRYVLCHWHVS